MKKVSIVLIALAFSSVASAQSTRRQAPTPPSGSTDVLETGWNVAVNGAFSTLTDSPTNNGLVAGMSFRVATHWDIRSDIYSLASPAVTVALAGPEYRFSLAHVIKSNPNFAINAANAEAFINVEVGNARTTATVNGAGGTPATASKFASSVGLGIDYHLSDIVMLRPLDVKYIRSNMLTGGGAFVGNHIQFAAGLGLRF